MKKQALLILVALLISNVNAGIINLSGYIVSDNQKMITSRYMGFIKSMKVSEGDTVKKNQLLYEIDSKEIDSANEQVDLSLSAANLTLQMNKNQYNNTLMNLARHKRLYKQKMVSKFELETLQLAVKNLGDMVKISAIGVKQAKEKKKKILNQYNYLKIKSPSKGVVISKKINEGEMSIPGMPALILTDLSKLKIITTIGESNLQYISIGKKVRVEVPSIKLKTSGRVESIIPSSNQITHRFKIKISFDDKKQRIYPGMYTKLTISQEK